MNAPSNPMAPTQPALTLPAEIISRMLDRFSSGVIVCNPQGRVTSANTAAQQLFRMSLEELEGSSVSSLMNLGPEHPQMRHMLDIVRMRGYLMHCIPCLRGDGTLFECRLQLHSLHNDQGDFVGVMGFHEDISTSERPLVGFEWARQMLDHLDVAINLTRRSDLLIVNTNAAFERIFETEPGEYIGQHISIINAPSNEDPGRQARQIQEQLLSQGFWRGELTNISKTGRLIESRAFITSLDDPLHGEVWLSFNEDVTEQRVLERHLKEARQLQALGNLSGGIAHDMNNVLQGIMLVVEALKADLRALDELGDPLPPRLFEDLKAITDLAHRGRSMTHQVLTFARTRSVPLKPLCLSHVVQDWLPTLQKIVPRNVEVSLSLPQERCAILGNQAQLNQILLNLTTNALDAMKGDHHNLSIHITQDHTSPEDPRVVLSVSDTGEGIPEAIKDQIFEPFFSSRHPEGGHGMGLAVVHGAVHAHNAHIEVHSRPGKGTTMHIAFPAHNSAPRPSVSRSIRRRHDSPLKVACIDDEALLLMALQRNLQRLNITADTFTSAEHFVEHMTSEQAPHYDAILCDQTMPGMTGIDLACWMAALFPEMPFVLCTGFATEKLYQHIKELPNVHGPLLKPLLLEDLDRALRNVARKSGAAPTSP